MIAVAAFAAVVVFAAGCVSKSSGGAQMIPTPTPGRAVLMEQYEHPVVREIEELARTVGGHGGMDFVMDYRLIYCLQRGLPLDMDASVETRMPVHVFRNRSKCIVKVKIECCVDAGKRFFVYIAST